MNSSGRNLIKDLVEEENAGEARQIFLKAYTESAAEISSKEDAEDFAHDKPSKEFTDSAIQGYVSDEIYSVGDGKADILMAHNYKNGQGILVWTDANYPEFERIKPDIVSPSLKDLKKIFQNQKERS